MILRLALLSSFALLWTGCKGGCEDCLEDYGGGEGTDGRLVSDVYTWECTDGGWDFEGVFSFDVSLEYAPDAITSRQLPAEGGCTYGLTLFAEDAGEGAEDVPGLESDPVWTSGVDEGTLEWHSEGFYMDEAYRENEHSCQYASTVLGSEGIWLKESGSLNGVGTPIPGNLDEITLNGEANQDAGFSFGEEIDIQWSAEGWDETWIQIRRESSGVAKETITCNATGMESFLIDDSVWDYATEDLPGVTNNVFVAFQNTDEIVTDYRQKVEVATRAMHVGVIID